MATGIEPQTFTVDEAAKILGIGRRQAYEAVRTGTIPSLSIGRRILIPSKRLLAMLEGHPQDAA
ncbi:helix-turn-helix domain-containing protein [Micrococcaceae bacterium Sec5.7]